MHNHDIASLVRAALEISGCSTGQIGSFDAHSTIQLELADLPVLNIAQIDNALWMWSTLLEVGDTLLAQRSENLLRFLMQEFTFAKTGQLQLCVTEGQLVLKAMVDDSGYANPQALAESIDSYLIALQELLETCG